MKSESLGHGQAWLYHFPLVDLLNEISGEVWFVVTNLPSITETIDSCIANASFLGAQTSFNLYFIVKASQGHGVVAWT